MDNKGAQIAGLVCLGVGLAIFSLAMPEILPEVGFMAADEMGGSMLVGTVQNLAFGYIGNGILGGTGVDSHALDWKRVLIDTGFNAAEGMVFGAMFHPTVLTKVFGNKTKEFWAGYNRFFWKYNDPAPSPIQLLPTKRGFILKYNSVGEITGTKFLPRFLASNAVESPLLGARFAAEHRVGEQDWDFKKGALLAIQPFNMFVRVGFSATVGEYVGNIAGRITESTTRSWAIPGRMPTYGF